MTSEQTIAVRLAGSMGISFDAVEVLTGGNQNHAVRLRSQANDVVVRFARDTTQQTMDPFDVEQWCSRAAAAAGVVTPATVARERLEHYSVIVHHFVPGVPANARDLQAWRSIGAVAAALAEVDTIDAPDGLFSRFGRDLQAAWIQHLDYNLEALTDSDPLLQLAVYESRQQDALKQLLAQLRGRALQQGLCHGDLSTRNVIATPSSGYVVLDWGSAAVGPVPWTDLEQIYRWHVTGDPEAQVSTAAWRAVLAGAGVEGPTANQIITELATLRALDVVRWARDRRPDRLAELVREGRTTIHRVLN